MRIRRRIYVVESARGPLEMFFTRQRAEAALPAYRNHPSKVKVVPYAPLLPARRKKRT